MRVQRADRRKIFSPKLEVRVENADVECEPNSIEDVLHGYAVRTKSVNAIQQFPRKVQRQRIKWYRIRLVSESDSDSLDINNRPANTADDRKNQFEGFEVRHAKE